MRVADELELPLALVADLGLRTGDLFAMEVMGRILRMRLLRDLTAEDARPPAPSLEVLQALLTASTAILGDLGRLPIPPTVLRLTPGARLVLRVVGQGGDRELLVEEAPPILATRREAPAW